MYPQLNTSGGEPERSTGYGCILPRSLHRDSRRSKAATGRDLHRDPQYRCRGKVVADFAVSRPKVGPTLPGTRSDRTRGRIAATAAFAKLDQARARAGNQADPKGHRVWSETSGPAPVDDQKHPAVTGHHPACIAPDGPYRHGQTAAATLLGSLGMGNHAPVLADAGRHQRHPRP